MGPWEQVCATRLPRPLLPGALPAVGERAKRVGEGLPKGSLLHPCTFPSREPQSERLWARWPWGQSHPGDEAALGTKPPRATRWPRRQRPPRGAPSAQSVRPSFLPRELLRQPLHHGRGEVRLHAPRGLPLRREQRPQLPGEPARPGRHRGDCACPCVRLLARAEPAERTGAGRVDSLLPDTEVGRLPPPAGDWSVSPPGLPPRAHRLCRRAPGQRGG